MSSLPTTIQAACIKISGTAEINRQPLPRSSSAFPSSLPYGAAPNIEQEQNSSRIDLDITSVPKPVSFSFIDRISHHESLICRFFLAKHTLPLSMAPHLIELAQDFFYFFIINSF